MKMSNGFIKVSMVIGICVGVISIAKVGFTINNRLIDGRVSAYIDNCGMSRKIDNMAKDITDIKLILALVNKGNKEYDSIKKMIDEK